MAKHEPPAHQHTGCIKDARGRKVTQLDPVAAYLLRQHDVIEADVLRAIAHEKGVRITRKERVSLIVGVGGLVIVVGLFLYSLLLKKDFGSAPLARTASLFYFCLPPWLVWHALKRSRFGKVAGVMLMYLRCPHCGYDLRLLPTDSEDGATVCPECGSAWMLKGSRPADAPDNAASGSQPTDYSNTEEGRNNS